MENTKILSDLQTIFRDVLDNDDIKLTEQTTAKDVEEWDSLTNIQLIVAVEKFYKIKFSTPEISSWKNIGDLMTSIAAKAK